MFAQVTINSLLTGWWPVWPWPGAQFSWVIFLTALIVLLILSPWLTGSVLIDEREVGVVIKKFGFAKLPPGQLIALNSEAGYQADTLAPGLHFGYWFFQYRVGD